ncbi:MAG TPA: cytochrome ubiquinol oxidase subunit I [Candidatus Elarobacter sp.]|jgi:cytochrome d ubiquinol oxidase subunit I|nr:cytochrome ubiquinol oxidase subunit I [Candidatus Elarobacter sp.]
MDHVIAARAQMGTSLAFHIVFACLGVGLPLLVVAAEAMWLRTHRRAYYDLARTWSKGMAILFAVGAVSGTVLSFELGLLWPVFMRYAGGIIGLPFSLEGFAFFIEAIFIGLYLYGWDRLSPRAHWLTGIPVVISGALSAGFVTTANAWMNMPTGFRIVNGQVTDVNPIAAMFSPPWLVEVTHTTIAAYVLTGFGAAAVCAFALLRRSADDRREQVRAGLTIGMIVATVAIPLQWIAGDVIARFDADHEPAKFASLEAIFHSERHAPVTVGGIVGSDGVRYGIVIPGALSILVAGNPDAEVPGLDRVARNDRPPVAAVHYSFDTMVGSASLLLLVAIVWLVAALRRRELARWLLIGIAICGPVSVAAVEAGWFVTEFGRQPWIARGLLRTTDAVTIAPGLDVQFYGFSLVYVVLAAACWWLLRRVGTKPRGGERRSLSAHQSDTVSATTYPSSPA